MDGAIALNNNITSFRGMENTKNTKKEVMKRIKDKLENAKLNLIYQELEELGININKNYTTVEELKKDLKNNINELDYNKSILKIKEVEESLDTLVKDLDNNSTNAFTKVMTSDLSKSIAKTLGISLAGRTALILAPTIEAKALIGVGLAGYGLYKVIKNRKEIIKINESNELNNILMDLEITKEDGKYIDTRFNEETTKLIKDFLKNNNIPFEDTGYRSLRQKIYSLEDDKKRSLCELLNNNLAKGIEIDKRMDKAKKKLNVASSTATTLSAGAVLGIQAATVVNSLDPALTAAPLNGTVLAAWINSVSDKKWMSELAGGLGTIGSGVLEHIPIVGGAVNNVLAAENLASFATIGAAGGLAVGAGLGVASVLKRIHSNNKNKKEIEEFLKLDSEKYKEIDKEELNKIQEKVHEPTNLVESVIVDIVIGYLKDNNIKIEGNPQTTKDLKEIIDKMPTEDRKKATEIMNIIVNNLERDNTFADGLKKAGKISIGLFTAGLAALSVYDILKGGTFLPELSQKIFPTNNLNSPIQVPEDINQKLDMNNDKDINIHKEGEKFHKEFTGNVDKYMTEDNGDYSVEYGYNYGINNPGFAGYSAENGLIDYGQNLNLIERLFGIKMSKDLVPNIPLITEKLNSLSPQELHDFYRYFNTLENDGTPIYNAIKEVLGYNKMIEKATSVITDAESLQKMNDIINKITGVTGTSILPVTLGIKTIQDIQKQDNKDLINKDDLNTVSK